MLWCPNGFFGIRCLKAGGEIHGPRSSARRLLRNSFRKQQAGGLICAANSRSWLVARRHVDQSACASTERTSWPPLPCPRHYRACSIGVRANWSAVVPAVSAAPGLTVQRQRTEASSARLRRPPSGGPPAGHREHRLRRQDGRTFARTSASSKPPPPRRPRWSACRVNVRRKLAHQPASSATAPGLPEPPGACCASAPLGRSAAVADHCLETAWTWAAARPRPETIGHSVAAAR